jgi:uncharacterized protein YndB with AHSA1/START domain
MNEMKTQIQPVHKELLVPGTPEDTFRLFTERIDEWWPAGTHSVAGDDVAKVVVDGGTGGRIYEVSNAGVEHEWGVILAWEPGSLLEATWYPGLPPQHATHLLIRFVAEGDRTRVTLVHDGWEARGVIGPEMRENYDAGWDLVLGEVPGMTPA